MLITYFLNLFQHLLLISSDTLTPQFLAREAKRLLKQQDNNKKNEAEDISVNKEVRADLEDTSSTDSSSTSTTASSTSTSTLKRKRLLGKSEPVKKLKVSNPVAPPQPVVKPPQQQQQQQQLKPVNNIQYVQPQQLSQGTQQLRQLPIISKPDSVLVRLSSGQVVLVPRELLKKVNPAAANTVAPAPNNVAAASGPVAVTAVGQNPAQSWQNTPVKVEKPEGLPNGSDLPVNVTLAQALDMLRKKYSTPDGQQTTTLNMCSSPRDASNSILNQLTDNSTQNGRNFRYIKIRAYQGPPPNTAVTSPPPQVATTPATSSLSQQLVKIQQLPVNPLPQTTLRPTFTAQRSVPLPSAPFNVTRIVQQQQQQQSPGRRTVMLSSPGSVVQNRPQFMTLNGGMTSPFQGGQNPMKICIIHSPRKADGTPVSPGSATPGTLSSSSTFSSLKVSSSF